MTPFKLTTPRLVIRDFISDDFPAVNAYMSDPAVTNYLEEGRLDEAGVRRLIRQSEEDRSEFYPAFAMQLKSTGTLIGHIRFHPWFSDRVHEIGWVCHPDFQGRGYTTEAAAAVLDYGFKVLNAHRIIATCQPENGASYRVMEKLGMRREGHFKKCIYRGDGVWWDEYFYAILAEEWTL